MVVKEYTLVLQPDDIDGFSDHWPTDGIHSDIMANNSGSFTASSVTPWHTLSIADCTRILEVDPVLGLSDAEVDKRRRRVGSNLIEEGRRSSLLTLFLHQFTDVMILVLIGAAIIAGLLGEIIDTIAIVVILTLNAMIGMVQEYRAEKALSALRKMTSPTAMLRRDGNISVLPAADLVPGDIVLLEAGNLIPADLRLLESVDLQVDESTLTGESQTLAKTTDPLTDPELVLMERCNMVFKGTHVTRGRGLGIIVATGRDTELGRIASLLTQESRVQTPLQKRLERFSKRLAIAILLIAGLMFILGLARGEPLLLMFMTAISLAVAAIPEALPAVVTISLALGVRKLSRHHALMRSLPAVETLGSVTYICSDKTGTLTRNEMTLGQVWAAEQTEDAIKPVEAGPFWQQFGQALALCNDSKPDADGSLKGDPTETALYRAASKAGFDGAALQVALPRMGEIPFTSERQAMTTLHRTDQGVVAYCKGSPEVVLSQCIDRCGSEALEPLQIDQVLRQTEALAARGYRVLAVAFREFSTMPDPREAQQIERDMTLLGLVGLIDPPREEVLDAVRDCNTAGITPVMITGDHPATAKAIAKQLLISRDDEPVITGRELSITEDDLLRERVGNNRIYARMTPEQKIAIVKALQAAGQVVAMTGDGVNDAPALKRADIGVAMGKKGTDVAREAAAMVLTDDNFATIVRAVKEGRRIFDNILKFIKYTMTSNSGEIWTLFLAPFLGLPIPLLPIQILWINLVTDGLPGLALSTEPAEKGIMQRPPRPLKESIFAHGMWQHMVWVGLLIGALSLGGQAWAYHGGSDNWQTVVFTVLTFSQLVHALVIRSSRESLFTIGLFSNPALLITILLTIGLQLLVIYVPFLNIVFHTTPLSAIELLACFSLPLVVLVAVESEKWLVRRGLLYS
jgi:Ca2+-transporting ATPase